MILKNPHLHKKNEGLERDEDGVIPTPHAIFPIFHT